MRLNYIYFILWFCEEILIVDKWFIIQFTYCIMEIKLNYGTLVFCWQIKLIFYLKDSLLAKGTN